MTGGQSSSGEKKAASASAVSWGCSSGKKWPPSTGCPVTFGASSRHSSSGPPSSTYHDPSGPAPAPQHEDRAGDPASGPAVGKVVLAVDAGCGAVLLTDRVDVVGVLQLRQVLRTPVLVERVRRCAPLQTQRVVDHRLWRRADESFGQGLGLRKQRPRPEAEGEPVVGAIPRGVDGDHIEGREALDPLRSVERRAVATRPPRSWPAIENRSKPSWVMTATMSRASARFEYGAWSAADAGHPLAP
jgi:hypothetical protein